jgi:ubiquinone/menaquinone biosynthesis C-methylase UbiE
VSDHEHWQLDRCAPELYERYLVPAITRIWATDLIDRVEAKPGQSVLDVACGTGVVARIAAERMRTGRVVGLDLNEGMLAVARSSPVTGVPIEWREGSALSLPFEDRTFDLVLCQLGVQFFPDRSLALREMKRVLVPTGSVALSVYSEIERTPAANAFVKALDQCLGPDASRIKRAEHIFSATGEVAALLADAGFEHISVGAVTKRITFPSVFDYVGFQLMATPMASLLGNRNTADRDGLIQKVTSVAQSFLAPEMLRDGRLTSPQEAYVAVALNPA